MWRGAKKLKYHRKNVRKKYSVFLKIQEKRPSKMTRQRGENRQEEALEVIFHTDSSEWNLLAEDTEVQSVENMTGKTDGRSVHQEKWNQSLKNQQLAQEVLQPQTVRNWAGKLEKTSLYVCLVLVIFLPNICCGWLSEVKWGFWTFVLIQGSNFCILT